jgi:hypothetical protein
MEQAAFRSEGFMRHDWVFDVLSDLHSYAMRNDLPGLAHKIEEAMLEAQREIPDAGSLALALVFRARGQAH